MAQFCTPTSQIKTDYKNIIFNKDSASVSIALSCFVPAQLFQIWGLPITKNGTVTGTFIASQYVIIFLTDLEVQILQSPVSLIPLVYLRYVDDIIIWTHAKELLEKFHQNFNNFHLPSNWNIS